MMTTPPTPPYVSDIIFSPVDRGNLFEAWPGSLGAPTQMEELGHEGQRLG